jgi:hypothetical protein
VNYRGISLLSTPAKVYGRVIIEKLREITEMQIIDEQGGFRKGRGCVYARNNWRSKNKCLLHLWTWRKPMTE